jgi:hypothetical protein
MVLDYSNAMYATQADYERDCSRLQRDHEMFVAGKALQSEHRWWSAYLTYMETLPKFDAGAWFSVVEEWLNRLEAIGEANDEARKELERMRRNAK